MPDPPDRDQNRGQGDGRSDLAGRDDEDGLYMDNDFREMHLTAEDHARDPSSRYDLMDLLGTGNFGKVYKARDMHTDKIVAIKQIDLENTDDDFSEIQEEIAHLQACDSPQITRYYGSFVKGYKLWIIMEFLAGSINDLLKPAPFSEANIAVTMREMLMGLEYLHSIGKIHRDIKAANVLISEEGDIKLADFGVSSQLSNAMSRRFTFVGTPFWMAPEVIARQSGYDTKADIWSLGITAFELAKGEPPHADKHPMKVVFHIPQAPPPRLDAREGWSDEFMDFVASCLEKDPEARPSASNLLTHPFIRQAGSKRSLIRLINRYAEWKAQHKRRSDKPVAPTMESYPDMTMMSEWNFDGTVKGMTVVGLPGKDSGRPEAPEQPGALGRLGEEYEEDPSGSSLRGERARLETVVVNSNREHIQTPLPRHDLAVDLVEVRAQHERQISIASDTESVSSAQQTVKPSKMPASPPRQPREPTAFGKASGAKAVLSSSQSKTADVLIDEAVLPAINKALKNAANAAEVQALQSMQQGFRILGASNPELADQLMLDMLAGIRENGTVRAHLTRKAKAQASLENVRDSFQNGPSKPTIEEQVTPQGPIGEKQTKDGYQIADVLYLRWLDNLRLKWPLGGT
ncbi:hypothetical protein QFC20_002946 [Naganishia adeliensis]|uniref:Uncharacterized protein n=1 Tax=Naganishia adeliensis TaxID=92952 RepID=A0ACC2WF22_9TREE|nr:hypothetical protein QFC20_002946 [Naganishia adeliensis]